MNPAEQILLCLSLAASITAILFTYINNRNMAQSFEEMQASINATNTALDNVQTEMTAQKAEIDALKEQVAGMGLTAEQEAVIAEGLAGIRTHAEAISTVDEGAEPIDPEQPEEPETDTPA